ncbi:MULTISPECIES: hypothetical protein [unclassified Bacillus (in: firmicutes)]|uniref:hypothetical protein n=1 Tax=unclassified Bacillus (in: firmicutes) TaxID=185979 RepID=UPI000BF0AFDF|nr:MULTISPECIES: hypothetical protein [unclassified Bacillus (in: firmicutes)]PEJ58627.1 hypothetical protein CN692_10180 [Bacillus sp. AFS002410]PEL09345.1 hypothetical protein CN601_16085 [Bacillus sp. AFS017336]
MDQVKLNYGKYEIPKTLVNAINLQSELQSEGITQFGELGGLFFSYEKIDTRYLNTPLDVIQFANTGSDGVHFGFLTDFGQVNDLENAYIVRVSPMDSDDPVQIVARNLRDFLRLLCYAPGAVEVVDVTSDEDTFHSVPEIAATQTIEGYDAKARKALQQRFSLESINSIESYLNEVKNERESEILLPTEDSLGITNKSATITEEPRIQKLFKFDDNDLSLDTDEVVHFFETSSVEAKLVFLREAQSKALLYDDEELKLYLSKQLHLMHLEDEAVRIKY